MSVMIFNDAGYWKERAYQAETKLAEGISTLRDQFAMAAMPAILAKLEYWGEEVEGIAELAYRQADAMLAARKDQP